MAGLGISSLMVVAVFGYLQFTGQTVGLAPNEMPQLVARPSPFTPTGEPGVVRTA